MELEVIRFSSGTDSTLGMLLVNRKFICYTLEDEARTEKVFGETRIPAGRYKVAFRTVGDHHTRYSAKFPAFHKGMLHILDVPNFTYILIHIGNTDDDTAGCLLLGDQANNNLVANGRIGRSTNAYKRVYPVIANALAAGEEVWIAYHDSVSGGAVQAETPHVGVVNANKLNFRLEPGLNGARSGVLNRGAPVRILEERGGWNRVRVEGWLFGKYLDSPETS